LKTFAENEHGNLPPVAMHELIMLEASGRLMQNRNISSVSITRSAAFFLFLAFVLQMIAHPYQYVTDCAELNGDCPSQVARR